MPDAYALTYLGALMIVGGVTLWRAITRNETLRLLCILVMSVAWLATQQAQIAAQDYLPVMAFFLVESVTVITFAYLAHVYKKLWIWWLGAIHAGVLGLDLAFVAGGQLHAFAYLSGMTALSYIAMIWILFGETTLQTVGGWVRDGLGFVSSRLSTAFGFNGSTR